MANLLRLPASLSSGRSAYNEALNDPSFELRDNRGAYNNRLKNLPSSSSQSAPPDPYNKLRQPTLLERIAIQNMEGIHPEKKKQFLKERKINPDYDRGITWHDFSTDLLDDAARGVGAAAVGIPAAGVGGLPLGAVGAGVGGALTQGAIDLGTSGLLQALGSDVRVSPTLKSTARAGLPEAVGSGVVGIGARAGLLQKAVGEPLKAISSFLGGPKKKTVKYATKEVDRLIDKAQKAGQVVEGKVNIKRVNDPDLLKAGKTAKTAVNAAEKNLLDSVKGKKFGSDINDLLVRKVAPELKKSGDDRIYRNVEDIITGNIQKNKGKLNLDGTDVSEIYFELGKATPTHKLTEGRRAIRDRVTLGDSKAAKGFNQHQKAIKEQSDFLSLNKGKPTSLVQAGTEIGARSTIPNISPEMSDKVYKALSKVSPDADSSVVFDKLRPIMGEKKLAQLVKDADAYNNHLRAIDPKGAAYVERSQDIGRQLLSYLQRFSRAAHNFGAELAATKRPVKAGSLMELIEQGGYKDYSLPRHLTSEAIKIPLKGAGRQKNY